MHHDDKSKLKLFVTGTLGNAVMLTALAPLCFGFSLQQVNRQSNARPWNGTWVLQKSNDGKKNSQGIGTVTLVILQTDQQIRVIRKQKEKGDETVQQLTYYTDGRGEANPTTDGKRTLKSISKLSDQKLIIRFSLPSNTVDRRVVINDRTDEWKLSSDGMTLTQTSSFTISSSDIDASNNPYGRPRAPNIFASPLRRTEKKVFKRI
jgi:hypothetical protein